MSLCTVLFEIINFFAAFLTVAFCSMIYCASSTARSSGSPFKTNHSPTLSSRQLQPLDWDYETDNLIFAFSQRSSHLLFAVCSLSMSMKANLEIVQYNYYQCSCYGNILICAYQKGRKSAIKTLSFNILGNVVEWNQSNNKLEISEEKN